MRMLPELPLKRRGRIVFALLGVLVLVGVVPFLVVAWKLAADNREALETTHKQFQLRKASTMAREFDSRLQSLRAQLYGLAQLSGAVVGRGGDAEAEIRTLFERADDPRMIHLRYSDLTRFDVKSRSAEIPAMLEALLAPELAKVAGGLRGGRSPELKDVVISEPVVLPTVPPRAVVVMTAPVVTGGRFRGAIFAIADLQLMWTELAANDLDNNGMFAVDRSGRMFASANLHGVTVGSSMKDSGIVRRFLQQEGLGRETTPFDWSESGKPEKFIGSYDMTSERWGVFVQVKRSDVYEPVNAMIRTARWWGLGAISIAVLAAIVFARTLSLPINRLAEASRAFARGDHTARVSIDSRNEIGELAETFNGMAEELESVIKRLQEELHKNRELFYGTAHALTAAIDAKDPYTHGHSARVSQYSVILAQHCGLSKDDIALIKMASLLHDVGKIGIDDVILRKPGNLTEGEFDIMKSHTTKGEKIMAPIRQMRDMLPGLRSHHERWNGGGYPDGLRAENIPLMARIIAVADSFDAMTTSRPYQQKMTFEAAAARINHLRETHFDQQVVAAFNRAFDAGEFREEDAAQPAPQPAVLA